MTLFSLRMRDEVVGVETTEELRVDVLTVCLAKNVVFSSFQEIVVIGRILNLPHEIVLILWHTLLGRASEKVGVHFWSFVIV